MLFCPRCGAPQILLPDHMRTEIAADEGISTTGAVPPPRPAGADYHAPGRVDWRSALPVAGAVALIAMLLAVAGMKWPAAQLISALWTMSGAVTAIGFYARSRPRASMDGRVGLRIGVAAGLLIVTAVSVGMAVSGVVVRYGLHGMAKFDEERAQDAKTARERGINWLEGQDQDKELQERYVAMMNSPLMTSPEMRAGSALLSLVFYGGLIVLLSGAGGAFAGMVRGAGAARQRLRPRE